MRWLHWWLSVALLLGVAAPAAGAATPAASPIVYLPWVARYFDVAAGQRIVNAPYFNVADVMATATFQQMAIFWFGRITPSENYIDVRVGYNNTELVVYAMMIDRYTYSDPTPTPAEMLQWDTVSVYLNLSGRIGTHPTSSAYRFDVQYSGGASAAHQAAFQGTGTAWASASVPFSSVTVDRWEANDGSTKKGWGATFRIPFSSLGLSRPADGTTWALAVVNRDRDSAGTPAQTEKTWPEVITTTSPGTWGRLRFNLPTYTPPPSTGNTNVLIRQGGGVSTPDGDVGGHATCGGDPDAYWTAWGETVYYLEPQYGEEYGDFNIQNQSDISDWPCFSKYYITFPLSSLPAGKVINAATLTLYHFGNSEPSQAQPSYIQVLTVGKNWTESSLNWNNAPLAVENVSVGVVPPLPGFAGFPGVARTWDVSRAVAQAYGAGQPLRLVLYSADSHYHSGKHFVSADTGDWNVAGRPALNVTWGNP